MARHLSFLDSELVARSVEKSDFDVSRLLQPGLTVYLQIPSQQLEAQRGLLRCWVSSLVRAVNSAGDERSSEVLFLLDEASDLNGLGAIEEALVRGRSAGARLLLAYQSDSKARAAFRDKPTLIEDNCGTQIHLGASGYEHAERLSKSLGDFTHWVSGWGTNAGWSRSNGANGSSSGVSGGSSVSYTQAGRPLLRPEEVLTLGEEFFIAWHRGLPAPVLGRRIRWFADRAFNPAYRPPRRRRSVADRVAAVLFLCLCGLAVRAKVLGHGYWQPEPGKGVMTTGQDRRGNPGGDGPPGTEGAAERRQPLTRKHR